MKIFDSEMREKLTSEKFVPFFPTNFHSTKLVPFFPTLSHSFQPCPILSCPILSNPPVFEMLNVSKVTGRGQLQSELNYRVISLTNFHPCMIQAVSKVAENFKLVPEGWISLTSYRNPYLLTNGSTVISLTDNVSSIFRQVGFLTLITVMPVEKGLFTGDSIFVLGIWIR